MANITLDVSPSSLAVEWVLHLPGNMVWVFDHLTVDTYPRLKVPAPHYSSGKLIVPIDLITAARLRLIKPGDDSGLGDEQWAWIKLLGLTGVN